MKKLLLQGLLVLLACSVWSYILVLWMRPSPKCPYEVVCDSRYYNATYVVIDSTANRVTFEDEAGTTYSTPLNLTTIAKRK